MNSSSALPPLGRWPLLFPILGAVSGILLAAHGLWLPVVALTVFGTYFGLLYKKPTYMAGAILSLLLAVVHNGRHQTQKELAARLSEDRDLLLTGTLIETNSAGLVRRLFETESGAKLILFSLPPEYRTGQKLLIVAQPIIRPQKRNPGGWDPAKTLEKKGIAGSVVVISAQPTGWSKGFPFLRGWSEDIRQTLAQRVTAGIPDREAAEIVRAVVLGEKGSGSSAFEDFRKTGTMHIFAVSGLHVGLVALIVLVVGRLVRLPPRVLLWTVVFAMFGYAFITGLRPPALRASLMGTLFIGRFLFLRRPSVVNNLFAAALVVLSIDSFQLWQVGFQLSFIVVGVILLLEPPLWKVVAPHLDHDPFLPKPVWTRWQHLTHWARNRLGKMFTVSLTAWMGSAPLSILYFGWFTPVAALASVLMVMVAFLILTLAFVGLIAGCFSLAAGESINLGNGLLAQSARYSAANISQWPGAWTRIRRPAQWQGGLCVFELKHGGAAVHLDAGGGVLIDSGSEYAFWWDVQPALEAHGFSPDSLIATHNDSQHIGGLESVVRSFWVKQALLPRETEKHSLGKLSQACRERQVKLLHAQAGQNLPIDKDTHIEVLHPGLPEMARADDRGLVLLIKRNNWKILLTADAGYETEKALLESGRSLKADVWICGRNPRDSMGHDAFLKAVSPRAIVASDQVYPTSEQVPTSWRQWLEGEGVAFYSQREEGAVFVIPTAEKLTLRGFLSDRSTTLRHSRSAAPAGPSPQPPIGAESPTWDQSSLRETGSLPASQTGPTLLPPTQSILHDRS